MKAIKTIFSKDQSFIVNSFQVILAYSNPLGINIVENKINHHSLGPSLIVSTILIVWPVNGQLDSDCFKQHRQYSHRRFLFFYKQTKFSMNIDQPRRSGLKTLSCLFQPPSELYDKVETSVIPSLHSQKMTLDKQDQQELFHKVLVFLQTFFTDKAFHKEMKDKLNKQRSEKYIGSSKQNQRILSFKKMNMGSRVCFDGEVTKKEEPHSLQGQQKVSRAANKKISIFIMEQGNSESSQEIYSDDFISQNSVKTIRSIEIPEMEMNFQTIALIYQSPQPFLINLSLCLFIRYCLATKHPVTLQRCAWVLTVATIVAYKLYYDEQIEGLIECFMEVLSIGRKDLIDLQRCFFEEIDYNTMISNYDYHFVLAKLLEMEPENEAKPTSKAV